jgi:organic radical activating enzyme
MLVEQIRALIKPGDHIVFTGGEPTIYAQHINEIAKHFNHNTKTIETNGTNIEHVEVNMLSISPKLSFSGNDMDEGLYAKQILGLIQKNAQAITQVKFVVSNPEELEQVKRFADKIESAVNHFMLMPQGITVQQIDEKMLWLAEACKELGWTLTDRQHIRLWKGARAT